MKSNCSFFERQDFFNCVWQRSAFPSLQLKNVLYASCPLRVARHKYRGKFAAVKDPRNVAAKRPVIRAQIYRSTFVGCRSVRRWPRLPRWQLDFVASLASAIVNHCGVARRSCYYRAIHSYVFRQFMKIRNKVLYLFIYFFFIMAL